MKVGVYLDLSDLYRRANRKFGRKLNFAAVIDDFKLKYPGAEFILRAYGIQRGSEASGFISCLERLGFQTQFKRPELIHCGEREIKRSNWDCSITVDVLRDAPNVAIVGTGSNRFAELARFVVESHRHFIAFGVGFGEELRTASTTVFEITEDILE